MLFFIGPGIEYAGVQFLGLVLGFSSATQYNGVFDVGMLSA